MGEIIVDEYIVEWDDDKAEINFKKHGIHFEEATRIFLDDNRINILDELHSDYEERIKIMGLVEEVLTVIYTERKEKFRIISARQASKRETEYYGQYSYL